MRKYLKSLITIYSWGELTEALTACISYLTFEAKQTQAYKEIYSIRLDCLTRHVEMIELTTNYSQSA